MRGMEEEMEGGEGWRRRWRDTVDVKWKRQPSVPIFQSLSRQREMDKVCVCVCAGESA